MKKTNEIYDVRGNAKEVLQFLKERYPLYHLSNIFFRDVHYGIWEYLGKRGVKLGYSSAESIAWEFIHELEGQGILRPVDRQTWTVDYPEFRTPQAKAPESAKPAPKPPAPPLKDQPDGKAGQ